MPPPELLAAFPQYSYADLLRQNIAYARRAMQDSLERGEAPFLSHLLYPQAWKETLREAGMRAEHQWLEAAERLARYRDLGCSSGMRKASDAAELLRIEVVDRVLFPKHVGDDVAIRQILNADPHEAFAELR